VVGESGGTVQIRKLPELGDRIRCRSGRRCGANRDCTHGVLDCVGSHSKACCCAVQNTTLFSSVTAWLVCCPKRDRRSVSPPMLRGHIA
jgi:hypothetical protein